MSSSSLLSVRLSPVEHAAFLALCKNQGLTASQVVRRVIQTMNKTKVLPFQEVDWLQDPLTQKSIRQFETGDVKTFLNVNDLMKDLYETN